MKIEEQKIKIVKNEGSINVISNEEIYYAKGISRVRNLKGKKFIYKYLVM